jgi:hypothetical protein
MKFQNYLQEEYFKRVKPKSRPDTSAEIFLYPTMKELRDIHNETQSEFPNVKFTLRFIFFPYKGDFPTDKWYAASAKIIHDDFDVGGNAVQIRAMGRIDKNIVKITIIESGRFAIDVIKHVMDKSNLRYELE